MRPRLMHRAALHLALVGLLGLLLGACEGGPSLVPCSSIPPGVPPSKLILRPVDGISGEYLVILDPAADAQVAARFLAPRHGGVVKDVWTTVLKGFLIALDDARAPGLALEPSVCYVEQNAYTRPAG